MGEFRLKLSAERATVLNHLYDHLAVAGIFISSLRRKDLYFKIFVSYCSLVFKF